jgi:TonB family protein
MAVAVALSIHLLPLAIVAGVLGIGQATGMRVGDEKGSKDGVNVEIINATEFDRRYVSYTDGKDAADSEATRPKPQQTAAPPESTAPPVPAELPAPPPAPPSRKLSEADIAEILEDAKLDLESDVLATSRASLANQGQASLFVRGVIRRLKQSMPKSNGVRGTVVIGIILDEHGNLVWVGVLKQSNNPKLDHLVLERVRSTKFEASGKTIPPRERKFQITYHYD